MVEQHSSARVGTQHIQALDYVYLWRDYIMRKLASMSHITRTFLLQAAQSSLEKPRGVLWAEKVPAPLYYLG